MLLVDSPPLRARSMIRTRPATAVRSSELR